MISGEFTGGEALRGHRQVNTTLAMMAVIGGAAVLAVAASMLINWASNQSPVWNVVFAVLFVVVLTIGLLIVIRWIEASVSW